jgi:hypothetical protein
MRCNYVDMQFNGMIMEIGNDQEIPTDQISL